MTDLKTALYIVLFVGWLIVVNLRWLIWQKKTKQDEIEDMLCQDSMSS